MVSLPLVRKSNSHLKSFSSPVAVFVGATQGIGLSTLQQYATLASVPKIYIVGRSEPVGVRIIDDLQARNAEGNYVFLKAEVSLLENVDQVCREIKRREKKMDLLFMSPGYISFGGRNGEIRPFVIPPLTSPPIHFSPNPRFLQKHQRALTRSTHSATTPAPSSSSVCSPFSATHLARALSSSFEPAAKAASFPTTSNSNTTTVFSTPPAPPAP